jgi:integrase
MWERDCRRWVQRSSLALSEVTPVVAERVALALGRLLDGTTPASSTTARRYRTTLRSLLRDAFEDGLLTTDPWTRKVAKAARASVDPTVNTAVLPDHADAQCVIDHIRSHHPASETYRVLTLVAFHLGLRPSEALALRWEDLELPDEGWGSVVISRTTDGAGGFGTTKTNRIRHVPVPQVLVAELRAFSDGATAGQLFETRNGRTPTLSNWSRAVKRACRDAGVAPMCLYDFRHLHATFLLNLGLAPAEIASRLGHSVDVLLRVYAGVMSGDRERANAAIERALETSTPAPRRVLA